MLCFKISDLWICYWCSKCCVCVCVSAIWLSFCGILKGARAHAYFAIGRCTSSELSPTFNKMRFRFQSIHVRLQWMNKSRERILQHNLRILCTQRYKFGFIERHCFVFFLSRLFVMQSKRDQETTKKNKRACNTINDTQSSWQIKYIRNQVSVQCARIKRSMKQMRI